jgi:hypothetical protein
MTNDARDAAWREHHDKHCKNWTPRDTMHAKTAFYAGWNLAVNPLKKKPVVTSLFPTMELGDDA